MIPSNKTDRCLSATAEMLSRVFEIPNVKFPLLVSKLFHLLSQPTLPPPLSHYLHRAPSLIPCLARLRVNRQPWPSWDSKDNPLSQVPMALPRPVMLFL